MAGLDADTPIPTRIVAHRKARELEIAFGDAEVYRLSFEFLRVNSPSAEVRGHGPGQEVLQVGKRDVDIEAIDPVGNYAIQPRFSDGHATGIYSWDYLHHLATRRDALWQGYLERLAAAGGSRDAGTVPASSAAAAGAGSAAAGVGPGAGPASGARPDAPFNAVPLKRS
ncbi:MAG: gamma-butyrobetaine hydroxylase-like domain-containing protein [Lautropia sp.]